VTVRHDTTQPAGRDVLLPDGMPLSRFHTVVLAYLRARQLHSGSRPRVDPGGHKVCRVALLEVTGNTVSWFLP
jgi:hypothetical protein